MTPLPLRYFGGCMVHWLCRQTSLFLAIDIKRRLSSQLSTPDSKQLKRCFAELGYRTDEISMLQRADVKLRFSQLARKYHPDTAKNGEVNVELLNRLHQSYKSVMKLHFNVDADGDDNNTTPTTELHFDIEHTAPQHRQFLEYGGVGYGTPFERQKHYQQHRVSTAIESAREFSYEKARRQVSNEDTNTTSLAELHDEGAHSELYRDVKRTKKVTGVIERVAEDLIASSMAQGLFDNLKGAGKPLPEDFSNPYIDEAEKRLNRILHSSGFVPSWILREAEIRQSIGELRADLRGECAQHSKASGHIAKLRPAMIEEFEQRVSRINRLIRDYNLIAPVLDRHFICLSLDREMERSIEKSRSADGVDRDEHGKNVTNNC